MNRRLVALSTLALALVASAVRAETYSVDPIHSSFIFKVQHANAANFYGRFNKAAGEVKTDAGALTSLSVNVEAESIDTNNKMRDEHLRSPDFFNTKEFPEITFKSTEVKKTGDNDYDVTGELTLHGTTKSITVKVTKTGEGKNAQGKDVIGFETSFTIKRSEYGMSGYIGKGVGDEVTLIVALESVKQ